MASKISPDHVQTAKVLTGTTYSYIYIKASEGKPTVLFLHGFPSSSYDWRHQVADFSKAGYGVLAPDLLGYGGTDKPKNKEEYRLRKMAGEVVDLLDKESLEQVVVVGHDWGSIFLSRLANWYPERFLAYVFLSVGFVPPGPRINIEEYNALAEKVVGYRVFGYWPFFNSEDGADLMERNMDAVHSLTYPADPWIWKKHIGPEGAFRAYLQSGEVLKERPPWQTAEEDEIHKGILQEGGMTGPLNWYKQELGGCNEADNAELSDEAKQLQAPTLLILCEKDAVVPPVFQIEGTKPFAKDLKMLTLSCGHWVMLESRDELFAEIDSFIKEKVQG